MDATFAPLQWTVVPAHFTAAPPPSGFTAVESLPFVWGHPSVCGLVGFGLASACRLFDPIGLFREMVSEPAQVTLRRRWTGV